MPVAPKMALRRICYACSLSAMAVVTAAVTACGGGAAKREREAMVRGLDTTLRAADLVFRRGSGMVSHAVVAVDQHGGGFSHIGLIVPADVQGEGDIQGQRVERWEVIHAVPGEPDFPGDPDRVKRESLTAFLSPDRAVTGAVMRIDTLSEEVRKRLVDKAVQIYKAHTLFDHDYDRADTTLLYCSELIDLLYRTQAGVDLPQGRETACQLPGFRGVYLLPSDIQQNPALRVVYAF